MGRNPRGIVINSTRYARLRDELHLARRDGYQFDPVAGESSGNDVFHGGAEPGNAAGQIQIGKELFNTSVGVFDPPRLAGQPAITGRMSNLGWGSCSSCHPEGLSDNVVWIFASGPRRTVPLHATFAPGNPAQQRALNWSAIFDQIEDFEGNIRNVSGGLGLFVQS